MALLLAAQQPGEHLDGFTKTHVVGQTAGEFQLGQKLEPGKTETLVGAQLADKTRRLGSRRQLLEGTQLFADAAEDFVGFDFMIAFEQVVEHQRLGAFKTQAFFVLHVIDERGPPFHPAGRQKANAAVGQVHPAAAFPHRLQEGGQGDREAAEIERAGEVEPVDAALHPGQEPAASVYLAVGGSDAPTFAGEVVEKLRRAGGRQGAITARVEFPRQAGGEFPFGGARAAENFARGGVEKQLVRIVRRHVEAAVDKKQLGGQEIVFAGAQGHAQGRTGRGLADPLLPFAVELDGRAGGGFGEQGEGGRHVLLGHHDFR